jgi:hypothetical protein
MLGAQRLTETPMMIPIYPKEIRMDKKALTAGCTFLSLLEERSDLYELVRDGMLNEMNATKEYGMGRAEQVLDETIAGIKAGKNLANLAAP